MSTILPLPSSPHWAPTTTTAPMSVPSSLRPSFERVDPCEVSARHGLLAAITGAHEQRAPFTCAGCIAEFSRAARQQDGIVAPGTGEREASRTFGQLRQDRHDHVVRPPRAHPLGKPVRIAAAGCDDPPRRLTNVVAFTGKSNPPLKIF